MKSNATSPFDKAIRLEASGRFGDALIALRQASPHDQHTTQLRSCLMADLLQRTGSNDEALSLATQNLRTKAYPSDLAARCHFVLGNVHRDRGDHQAAVGYFQAAERLVDSDLELACWIQLRLIAVLTEIVGSHAAMARLGEVRRILTKVGDARPFAVLHLLSAEMEVLRGRFDVARGHVKTAESLLADLDNAWLQSSLAIRQFALSYCAGDLIEAAIVARSALEWATVSGHRGALRAASGNLGQIQIVLGRFAEGEAYIQTAHSLCEKGSAEYIATADNLAQVRLQQGDFGGCQEIINQLEADAESTEHSRHGHYRGWLLQTKTQLLLGQRKVAEAAKLWTEIERTSWAPETRVGAALRLVAAEAFAENHDFVVAAKYLASVLTVSVELPPDLVAEMERVAGKTLALAGCPHAGRSHLQRAVAMFEVIGHSIGKAEAAKDLDALAPAPDDRTEPAILADALDAFRALLDTRRRPDLFAQEATALLHKLECAERIRLDANSSGGGLRSDQNGIESIVIDLGRTGEHPLSLCISPQGDPAAIHTAATFARVLERILDSDGKDRDSGAADSLWSGKEWSSNDEIAFAAQPMLDIVKTVRKVAPTDFAILITGETGTGKEVLAKIIHEHSGRKSKPFVAFNCAAVPRELLESQLFGHKRGAFSGAVDHFQGVIRSVSGGTLLLDEIGEVPLEMQPKLLRFLESGEVHSLGDARPTKVDVRLLFATNARLEDAVAEGRFREDLFYRINVIPVRVPPLRERREEIPLLVNLFVNRFCRELSRDTARVTTAAMERLILYDWPGNVRQLANEMRRLVALVDEGGLIEPHQLPASITKEQTPLQTAVRSQPAGAAHITVSLDQNLDEAMKQLERSFVNYALEKANGRVSGAAELLGLSRKGLYMKRQRLGLLD
jgi:DNA-binding NtrC family response regulator/tetratricopeptide (TPR) repeat protein